MNLDTRLGASTPFLSFGVTLRASVAEIRFVWNVNPGREGRLTRNYFNSRRCEKKKVTWGYKFILGDRNVFYWLFSLEFGGVERPKCNGMKHIGHPKELKHESLDVASLAFANKWIHCPQDGLCNRFWWMVCISLFLSCSLMSVCVYVYIAGSPPVGERTERDRFVPRREKRRALGLRRRGAFPCDKISVRTT